MAGGDVNRGVSDSGPKGSRKDGDESSWCGSLSLGLVSVGRRRLRL